MSQQWNKSAVAALPLGRGVDVVKVSDGIAAVFKPCGLRSHPNQSGVVDKGALIAAPFDLKRECYVLPDGQAVFLLHRIDAPTSGLLLLAFDAPVSDAVRALFAAHQVHKVYEALVFGDAGRGTQVWRDRLRTERGGHGARTTRGSSGDFAQTSVKILKSWDARNGLPFSRIRMEPETGRTHQLRVQCAERSLPIVGDATYGNFSWNRRAAKELGIRNLCLHAAEIRLDLPAAGARPAIHFSASCQAPEHFGAAGR